MQKLVERYHVRLPSDAYRVWKLLFRDRRHSRRIRQGAPPSIRITADTSICEVNLRRHEDARLLAFLGLDPVGVDINAFKLYCMVGIATAVIDDQIHGS